MFYKLKDSPVQWDGAKFTHLEGRVGAVLGYSVGDILKKRGFPVEDRARDTKVNITKLLKNRVDVIAGSETQVDAILRGSPKKYTNVVKNAKQIVHY